MIALQLPEWADVRVQRPQAALVRVNDGFAHERQALLFVGSDGAQRQVPFSGGVSAKDAARVAIQHGAASEPDVLAVVEAAAA